MPQNKNALIRYKIIDKCLQNHYRQWTLQDLIEACSTALYELEGKQTEISKRSIQKDIQMMRSNKLGYEAPIVVYDKKYYKYDDPNYSIDKVPITEEDIKVLAESVEVLKQFKNFSLFDEMDGIIAKLEDVVYTEQFKQPAIIHLEKNENLKGLEHLEILYQAILKKICIHLTYQSFKAREASLMIFHPYILKEFNNRWFLIGRINERNNIMTCALDRIIKVELSFETNYQNNNFDGMAYYENTIGVTVLRQHELTETLLKINAANAPYVLTKPFHKSQKIVETYEDHSVLISVKVHLNFEFERLILGFGKAIEVVSPNLLRKRIKRNLEWALKNYEA